MKRLAYSIAALLPLLALCGPAAQAGLLITPVFESDITTDPNAAAIETAIDNAIANVEAEVATSISVTIDFQEMSSGLGESSTYISSIPYSSYVSTLETAQTPDAADTTAIASLGYVPGATANPVNAGTTVTATLPVLRALGFSASPPTGQPDSTISLNTSICFYNRSNPGSGAASKYDLQSTAAHEIDEVLGTGGAGSELNQVAVGNVALSGGAIGPLDLFRYSGLGVRSYSTSASAPSTYFSINGGATRLVGFNQNGAVDGSDFGDWGDGVSPADGQANTPAQVQDAYGNPGTANEPNLGPTEVTALDVVGYNLTPAGLLLEGVPEPGSAWLLGAGATLALALARLRRKAA